MTHTIRIHRDAPPKPAWGAACNGCGVCCAAEPCPIGMLVSARRTGACRALVWDDGNRRYRCGLLAIPVLERAARRLISAGSGCDLDAEVLE